MPFDDLSRRIDSLSITERLAALGITPIDPALVKAHKLKMIAKKGRDRPSAEWRERILNPRHLDVLARIDEIFVTTLPALPRSSSAPTAVIDVAQRIRHSIPEADFRLGYFYKDPYLSVRLPARSSGADDCAYIGLWLNRRRLIAVAHQAGGHSLAFQQWRTFLFR